MKMMPAMTRRTETWELGTCYCIQRRFDFTERFGYTTTW